MVKRRFSSRLAGDEIKMCGNKALTFLKCTTIMKVEFTVMSRLCMVCISWVWYGMVWFGCDGS
jgi:hypothetical protein